MNPDNTQPLIKTLYRWGVKRTATLAATRPSIEQNPATGQYAYSYCGRYTEDKASSTQVERQAAAFQWDLYMETGTGKYFTIHKDA